MPNEKPVTSQDDKLMGALSYLWILSVVMLVIKKDSEFVKFHARQGLILFIVSFLWFIPVVGWIVNLAVLLMIVIGFFKAYSGEKWEMPVIGALAKKINL
ncbi:MAG: hypothetical protein PHH01_00985 [Patescibacteria group bacterium]|nr:hypothetical protein [Patescibacteria group bacterium]MDD5566748.1 hypothetical protein [Patescibacteria group bacterium]